MIIHTFPSSTMNLGVSADNLSPPTSYGDEFYLGVSLNLCEPNNEVACYRDDQNHIIVHTGATALPISVLVRQQDVLACFVGKRTNIPAAHFLGTTIRPPTNVARPDLGIPAGQVTLTIQGQLYLCFCSDRATTDGYTMILHSIYSPWSVTCSLTRSEVAAAHYFVAGDKTLTTAIPAFNWSTADNTVADQGFCSSLCHVELINVLTKITLTARDQTIAEATHLIPPAQTYGAFQPWLPSTLCTHLTSALPYRWSLTSPRYQTTAIGLSAVPIAWAWSLQNTWGGSSGSWAWSVNQPDITQNLIPSTNVCSMGNKNVGYNPWGSWSFTFHSLGTFSTTSEQLYRSGQRIASVTLPAPEVQVTVPPGDTVTPILALGNKPCYIPSGKTLYHNGLQVRSSAKASGGLDYESS